MTLRFDTSVPNVARIYNVLLGGKDNYEADRAAAGKILQIEPRAAIAAVFSAHTRARRRQTDSDRLLRLLRRDSASR